jgi:hypothetical protein
MIRRPNVLYMENWTEVTKMADRLKETASCWVVAGARDEKLRTLRDNLMNPLTSAFPAACSGVKRAT